ncbi:MAG TPA: hypothetical protein VK255_02360 [Patescibacteria group bacterium]|nr:hypothetical protein [Patescibacteria group bacterium]
MSIIKKIFLLSAIILILSLLLWGVYNLSFKKPKIAPKNSDQSPKNEEITDLFGAKKDEKIKAISDEMVIGPAYDTADNLIKYYSTTGDAYKIDTDGNNKTTISDKKFPGLSDVLWSPDKTKAITKSIENGQAQFYYYNYSTQQEIPIKNNVDEIAWQTSGNRIFYKYYDSQTKKRSFNISDPDGTNWIKLSDINYRNVSIAPIPKSGLVSFWNQPDSYTQTIFETVPVISGEKKTIYKEKYGADYLWSTDGSLILVSSSDTRAGTKMQLGVMNYNGGEYRNLDIPTFVSKCVWSRDSKTVYYSLPGDIPSSAILPNEYMEGKFKTVDTFWKVNIADGKKSRIIETSEIKANFDAAKLFLNDDESALFFVNKYDGKLYKIAL